MFWTGKPDGKMWPAKREVYGMLHALQVKDFHFQPLNFPIIQRRCGPKGYILYVVYSPDLCLILTRTPDPECKV